jgi:DNA-binding HxlR family transcriptional regulator
VRAGGFALSLLSVPLNVQVLQALEEEPRSLIDLRRAIGSPPPTTMRGHLRTLTELGVLDRRLENEIPGSIAFELGGHGRDLLAVADILAAWLRESPEGPIELGSSAAKNAIKALVEGWSSAIIRALAAKPLSLTELSRLISGLSYPSLERRLGTMRLAGQIERRAGAGRGTPYAVTSWLQRAVGPLAAAQRWERATASVEAPPLTRIDIEALFLLAVPLVVLPAENSGVCRLAIDLPGEQDHRLAGAMVEVREGKVVACVSNLKGSAGAWALGSTAAWLAALIEDDLDQLELGGDCQLATAMVDRLHSALFRAPAWT